MAKYTPQDIINSYKEISKTLGYNPLPKDLRYTNYRWIILQINKKFGTYESFFQSVGLEYPGRKRWDKNKLISEFKFLVHQIGYVPSINQVRNLYKKGDMVKQIYKIYGNYYLFLSELSLKPKKKHKGYWTKESIKSEYFKIVSEQKYFVSYSNLRELGYHNITVAILKKFNTVNDFYSYCGITPRKKITISWTKDKVINEVNILSEDLGRCPTEQELRKLGRNDLALAIRRYFDGYKRLQSTINLEGKKRIRKEWSVDDIIFEYTKVIKELGFPPTYGELCNINKSVLATTISKKIGFTELLKRVGYEPRMKVNFWTAEKIKEEYLKEWKKLGRTPTMNELKTMRSDLFSQISRIFGGITNLAEEMGFQPSKSFYDPLWKPWEKFVVTVCIRFYGGHYHKRLSNRGVPDFISSGGELVVDAKLSYYPLIKKDIIKYAPFTKKIEFWLASSYVPKSSEKVKYLGILEIKNLLMKNNLTEFLPELALFEKRMNPLDQKTLLSVSLKF